MLFVAEYHHDVLVRVLGLVLLEIVKLLPCNFAYFLLSLLFDRLLFSFSAHVLFQLGVFFSLLPFLGDDAVPLLLGQGGVENGPSGCG